MIATFSNPPASDPVVLPTDSSTADLLSRGTARHLWALTRSCLGRMFLRPFPPVAHVSPARRRLPVSSKILVRGGIDDDAV